MLNTPSALLRGRVRIPLSRVRRALGGTPVALELEPAGPRLRVRGAATALGAPIRFSTDLELSGLRAQGRARLLTLRFHDTRATVPDDAPGPLAQTLRAGLVDLERVGDRVSAQLGLPTFIAHAAGNSITLDLMQLPGLTRPERAALSRGLLVGTRALSVRDVRVVGDALELHLHALPAGVEGLGRALVAELLLPKLSRWAHGGPP